MRRILFLSIPVILMAGLISCGGGTPAGSTPNPTGPVMVTILGYSGPQEDPVISPDNQFLFFDSHNDAGIPPNLFYAERIDYKTFRYVGPVQGANGPGQTTVRGNYDLAFNFYFASSLCGNASLFNGVGICHGTFSHGVVTGVAAVQGIQPPTPPPGDITAAFDVAISPDGQSLFYTYAVIDATTFAALTSQISLALKNPDGSFFKAPDSDTLLQTVNAASPLVYAPIPDPNGLELFFTLAHRGLPFPAIYVVKRSSPTEPYGAPTMLGSLNPPPGDGFVETGSLSPDGKCLYYHQVVNPTTSQIWVSPVD